MNLSLNQAELASDPELSPDRRHHLESQWLSVVGRFEALFEQSSAPQIHFLKYEKTPGGIQEQYGVPIIAQYRSRETGKEIVVHERFFTKSENEQVYILTHELSHALSEKFFTQTDVQNLYELCQYANDNCETRYVTGLRKAVETGRISERQYFSEQIAERLTAYLLGERKLSGMLAVHAMYAQQADEVFKDIPMAVMEDEEAFENYLLTAEDANQTIKHFRACYYLFESTFAQNIREDELDEYFGEEIIELESLGQSQILDTYTSISSATSEERSQPKGLWQFLLWLLSPPK